MYSLSSWTIFLDWFKSYGSCCLVVWSLVLKTFYYYTWKYYGLILLGVSGMTGMPSLSQIWNIWNLILPDRKKNLNRYYISAVAQTLTHFKKQVVSMSFITMLVPFRYCFIGLYCIWLFFFKIPIDLLKFILALFLYLPSVLESWSRHCDSS